MNKQAVVALIFNETHTYVLSVSRKDNCEDFGLPGGKVDFNETLHEALIREVREETGLEIEESVPIFAEEDSSGFFTTTFLVTTKNTLWSSDEAGIIDWKTPLELKTSGTFQAYNARLFNSLEGEE